MYLIECCNTNILHCPIRMKYCVACVCPMQYVSFLTRLLERRVAAELIRV